MQLQKKKLKKYLDFFVVCLTYPIPQVRKEPRTIWLVTMTEVPQLIVRLDPIRGIGCV